MIWFVGAGSGAADLITVRGMKLLSEADIIIYTGSLVSEDLLSYAKKGCTLYNSAYMTLDEVISIMDTNRDKKIVRLHTGDPCVFGAVREQYDRLEKLGIEYSVCPGVSSFCGAAASLKAEYTLPDVSQTVILTRAQGRTPVPEKERIELLAKHHATMVIFLSAGLGREVQDGLINGGYSPDTPAALVYRATWDDERIYRCTVGEIAVTLEEKKLTKHTLICVGDFLMNDYSLSKLYSDEFETQYRRKK